MPIEHITIIGTGLIGTSIGLALHERGFGGRVTGWDLNPSESALARERGALDEVAPDALEAARRSGVTILSGPVFTILDWLTRLAPALKPGQLVTDVGSVKGAPVARAHALYNLPASAGFLPGHPMAGREVSGAANAEAGLFDGAAWLFTETPESRAMHPSSRTLAEEWRSWAEQFGCRVLDLSPARHDEICAWVSHLPQFLATALSALFDDEFAATDEALAIGGRALREMTRLGASPYSMWRDVAHTNTAAIAAALLALEQRLADLRENLKRPELRDEFDRANHFRTALDAQSVKR